MAKTYIDGNGYRRFADSGKSVSRWVAEKKFGHSLSKGSVVHHRNRNKLDNKPSNLWVFKSQKRHNSVHWTDKRRTDSW